MKQKIIFFLVSSLVFSALIILGALRLFNNYETVIILGMSIGFLFGLLITLIMIYIHSSYLRKAGLNKTGLSVVNSIEIEATGNKEEVIALCIETIRSVKKSELGLVNKNKGLLTVNVGVNWRTWGDSIQFEVKAITDHKCNVVITSRPTLRTTLIDLGKNLDNVIKITNDLKSKAQIKVLNNNCNITET
ncbi:hypothetical protein [Paenibacillus lemnae]|uniref:Uncharacterized protein n=1 Tax=Paenibacillus lemnae TaxID=1330551 RepID=A0A848ME87_PAELE|nr:hypothetical protein [Paenibacillus lemnae]NMO97714.1 hypothetical protein [Paenibacillus lemnae]